MIETAVLVENDWPEGADWPAVGAVAVNAALAGTPYAALIKGAAQAEISIKFTGDAEVQALNLAYRGKDRPTNVLSFPMIEPELMAGITDHDGDELLLGDIVLAYETCLREAGERAVSIEGHATHLIVHGTLHLLGYDHKEDDEAEAMESLEQQIMASLGLHNPYEAIED